MLTKRNISLCLSLLSFLNFALAQDQEKLYTISNGTVNDVYIPFSGTLSEEKTVDIFVNFIEDAESSWPPAARGAFEYAVNILSNTLTSEVPIEIDARYIEFPFPPGGISSSLPLSFSVNFASDDPLYRENTLYPGALANKLAGVDLNPSQVDMSLEFNNLANWYFGTDGEPSSTQIDFVTTVLHEMIHGVGFLSTASITEVNVGGTTITTGTLGRTVGGECYYYPFDLFLCDFENLLIETPTSNDGLCQGDDEFELDDIYQSNFVFWESTSDADDARIHAPSDYDPFGSIDHLHEGIYEGTSNGLMVPYRSFQEAIHDPGTIGIAMLQDIGWEAVLVSGIEDHLEIVGFDIDCFNSQDCPYDGFEGLYIDISDSYSIGDQIDVIWNFTDEYPYSPLDASTAEWNLEILHSDGVYIHESIHNPSNTWWSFSLNELPTGYTWTRNFDGQIEARINLSVNDINGYIHEASTEININHAPTSIDVNLNITSEDGCSEMILSFYAPGATIYEIMYQPQGSPFYFFETVPAGQLEYSFDNLNEGTDYHFIVSGENDFGFISHPFVTREACDLTVTTYPNPAFDYLSVLIEQEKIIDRVEIFKQDQPAIYKESMGAGSNFVDVNVADLPPGMYTVKVYDENGDMGTRTIVIL